HHLRRGVEDGVVEGGAEDAVLARAEQREVPDVPALLELPEGVDDVPGRVGVVAHEAQVIAEANQERAILGLQNGFEKRLQVVVMGFEKALLAAAKIHNETEG